MFNVAARYRLGDGVEKNLLKAAKWYERALVKDKFFAPFALGELYSTPGGLPPDNEKAIAYFQIALANGHQDARRELRRLGGHSATSTALKANRGLSLLSSGKPRTIWLAGAVQI